MYMCIRLSVCMCVGRVITGVTCQGRQGRTHRSARQRRAARTARPARAACRGTQRAGCALARNRRAVRERARTQAARVCCGGRSGASRRYTRTRRYVDARQTSTCTCTHTQVHTCSLAAHMAAAPSPVVLTLTCMCMFVWRWSALSYDSLASVCVLDVHVCVPVCMTAWPVRVPWTSMSSCARLHWCRLSATPLRGSMAARRLPRALRRPSPRIPSMLGHTLFC